MIRPRSTSINFFCRNCPWSRHRLGTFRPNGTDEFEHGAFASVETVVVNNPLTDLFFTGSSGSIIVTIGGYADKIIEPRLKGATTLDEDAEKASNLSSFTTNH